MFIDKRRALRYKRKPAHVPLLLLTCDKKFVQTSLDGSDPDMLHVSARRTLETELQARRA